MALFTPSQSAGCLALKPDQAAFRAGTVASAAQRSARRSRRASSECCTAMGNPTTTPTIAAITSGLDSSGSKRMSRSVGATKDASVAVSWLRRAICAVGTYPPAGRGANDAEALAGPKAPASAIAAANGNAQLQLA
jgi:hypothetical protein